jgi:sugar/nucleoside kinase (ribokinase family)
VKDFTNNQYRPRPEVILAMMFLAAGPSAAGFCEWVRRLGEPAAALGETMPAGVRLLHLEAQELLAGEEAPVLRLALEAARHQGAAISIDLGPPAWIRSHGSSRTAYQLATIQPDILFSGEAAAAELGAPLEGVAAVPVITLGREGCSVYGIKVAGPEEVEPDPTAFAAAFCVAFLSGEAPVEAAGRAVIASTDGMLGAPLEAPPG